MCQSNTSGARKIVGIADLSARYRQKALPFVGPRRRRWNSFVSCTALRLSHPPLPHEDFTS